MGALIAWFTGSRFAMAARKWGTIALTILLFLMSLRRSGERAGQLTERLENQGNANEIQRRMLEAGTRRPRNRSELVDSLRDGKF
ncbi:MAG: hypothetical protein COB08_006625 [Rhodobacteraceae bacterium]|nr:hypothetical protein [Paracoccaceae bacterium]